MKAEEDEEERVTGSKEHKFNTSNEGRKKHS